MGYFDSHCLFLIDSDAKKVVTESLSACVRFIRCLGDRFYGRVWLTIGRLLVAQGFVVYLFPVPL